MDAAFERLTKASHKLAEVMYSQQAGGPGGPTGGPGGAAGQPGGAGATDEVIDAEYVEK
jgi:molecular chaperone DnaK